MTPWDLFAAAAITGTMAACDPRDCAVMAAEAADKLMAERERRMTAADRRPREQSRAKATRAKPALPDEDAALVADARGKGLRVPRAATEARRRVAAEMIMSGVGIYDIADHLGVSPASARALAARGLKARDKGVSDTDLVVRYRHFVLRQAPAHVARARARVALAMKEAGAGHVDIARYLNVSNGSVSNLLRRRDT